MSQQIETTTDKNTIQSSYTVFAYFSSNVIYVVNSILLVLNVFNRESYKATEISRERGSGGCKSLFFYGCLIFQTCRGIIDRLS